MCVWVGETHVRVVSLPVLQVTDKLVLVDVELVLPELHRRYSLYYLLQ